jgi:hypothetical protein
MSWFRFRWFRFQSTASIKSCPSSLVRPSVFARSLVRSVSSLVFVTYSMQFRYIPVPNNRLVPALRAFKTSRSWVWACLPVRRPYANREANTYRNPYQCHVTDTRSVFYAVLYAGTVDINSAGTYHISYCSACIC